MDTPASSYHIGGVPGAIAAFGEPAAAEAAAEAVVASGTATYVVYHTPNKPGEAPSLVRCGGDSGVIGQLLRENGAESLAPTATRYLRQHRVRWPHGDATPGLGTIFWVPKIPSMPTSEFHRWWEHEHGPKALRHHMGMWDYAQVSLVDAPTGGSFEGIDGIAVVQWPVVEDLTHRFFDSDVGAETIRADAASFTDGDNTHAVQMTEVVLAQPDLDAQRAPVWVTDYRALELGCSPEALWAVAGDFAAIGQWWPSGLVRCETDGTGRGAKRRLWFENGSSAVETLLHHRPDERMFELEITEGLAPGLQHYRCRYEIRATPDGCRLDFQPTALVDPGAGAVFGAMVDRGWPQVSAGLGGAL